MEQISEIQNKIQILSEKIRGLEMEIEKQSKRIRSENDNLEILIRNRDSIEQEMSDYMSSVNAVLYTLSCRKFAECYKRDIQKILKERGENGVIAIFHSELGIVKRKIEDLDSQLHINKKKLDEYYCELEELKRKCTY